MSVETASNLIMRNANRNIDALASVVKGYDGVLLGGIVRDGRKVYDVEFPTVIDASSYVSSARKEFVSVRMLNTVTDFDQTCTVELTCFTEAESPVITDNTDIWALAREIEMSE